MNANPLLCPSWHTQNRDHAPGQRPEENVAQPPRPLPDGGVLHLDTRLLDDLLAHDGLPLLVDFWAPWCRPCKRMAPAFEEAARLLAPGVRLGKVDTERETGMGKHYHVQAIPTLVLFQGGRELDRISGARSAQDIAAWTRSRLGG